MHSSSPHQLCHTVSYLLPRHDFSIFHLELVGMLCNSPRFLATTNHNSTLDAEILVNCFSFEPRLYPEIHLKPKSLFSPCKHRGEH